MAVEEQLARDLARIIRLLMHNNIISSLLRKMRSKKQRSGPEQIEDGNDDRDDMRVLLEEIRDLLRNNPVYDRAVQGMSAQQLAELQAFIDQEVQAAIREFNEQNPNDLDGNGINDERDQNLEDEQNRDERDEEQQEQDERDEVQGRDERADGQAEIEARDADRDGRDPDEPAMDVRDRGDEFVLDADDVSIDPETEADLQRARERMAERAAAQSDEQDRDEREDLDAAPETEANAEAEAANPDAEQEIQEQLDEAAQDQETDGPGELDSDVEIVPDNPEDLEAQEDQERFEQEYAEIGQEPEVEELDESAYVADEAEQEGLGSDSQAEPDDSEIRGEQETNPYIIDQHYQPPERPEPELTAAEQEDAKIFEEFVQEQNAIDDAREEANRQENPEPQYEGGGGLEGGSRRLEATGLENINGQPDARDSRLSGPQEAPDEFGPIDDEDRSEQDRGQDAREGDSRESGPREAPDEFGPIDDEDRSEQDRGQDQGQEGGGTGGFPTAGDQQQSREEGQAEQDGRPGQNPRGQEQEGRLQPERVQATVAAEQGQGGQNRGQAALRRQGPENAAIADAKKNGNAQNGRTAGANGQSSPMGKAEQDKLKVIQHAGQEHPRGAIQPKPPAVAAGHAGKTPAMQHATMNKGGAGKDSSRGPASD